MGRRVEQRVEISLPVRVWGMDRNGKPFIQSAFTADITRSGARLRDLYCLDRAGEVIRIQHGSKKANFTIRWIGHPGSASDGQAGICCLDPDKYIWGVPLPQSSPVDAFNVKTPANPLLSNQGNASAFASLSPTAFAAEAAKVTRLESRSGEMRAATRYACNGMAEVGPEGGSIPLWCSVSDISISGCYAETTSPLPIDTLVYIRLRIIGVQVQALGVVRTTHHGIGMGIAFTEMNDEDHIELRSLLQSLAARTENGEGAFVPNPNSALFAHKPSPELLGDRSLLLVHNRPQGETTKSTPVADPQITDRLQQLVQELEALPAAFQANAVDPRVLQEFKNTLEHARRTAGAVQQWMELQSQNRDPFPAFHKLNEDRVRVVAGLNHRLSMDIDGGDIDLDNAALGELLESTKDLYGRLQKMFKK